MSLMRYNATMLGTVALGDNSFEAFSTSIANGASSLWSGIKSGLGTIADGVRSAYNYVTDGISNTATGIVNLFGSATAAIAGLWRGRRQEEGDNYNEIYNLAASLSACFVGETKILTKNGAKKIKEIEKEDLVYAYNEHTGENAYKKVLQVFKNISDEIIRITLENGRIIDTTKGHPFYVIQKGFILAKNLIVSDKLYDSNGNIVLINNIEILQKLKTQVYNFEVDKFHTYYVSESQILVHNESIPEGQTPIDVVKQRLNYLYQKQEEGKELTPQELKDLEKCEVALGTGKYSDAIKVNGVFISKPTAYKDLTKEKSYLALDKKYENLKMIEKLEYDHGMPKSYSRDLGGGDISHFFKSDVYSADLSIYQDESDANEIPSMATVKSKSHYGEKDSGPNKFDHKWTDKVVPGFLGESEVLFIGPGQDANIIDDNGNVLKNFATRNQGYVTALRVQDPLGGSPIYVSIGHNKIVNQTVLDAYRNRLPIPPKTIIGISGAVGEIEDKGSASNPNPRVHTHYTFIRDGKPIPRAEAMQILYGSK